MKFGAPLAGRTFLGLFLVTSLLGVSFFALNATLKAALKRRMTATLHRTVDAIEEADAQYRRRHTQLLGALSQSARLHAAPGLRGEAAGPAKRKALLQTIEATLRDLGAGLECDFLVLTGPRGRRIAAIGPGRGPGIAAKELPPTGQSRVIDVGGELYEATTVPIQLGGEDLSGLTCGRKIQIASLPHVGHLILMRAGVVIASTIPNAKLAEIQAQAAGIEQEGELTLGGDRFLALAVRQAAVERPYRLLSVQSLDAATGEFAGPLRVLFAGAMAGALVVARLLASAGSRSTTRPLRRLMEALRAGERTGRLQPELPTRSSIREVNELASAFNRAARSIEETQTHLDRAYLEFIETMAQALDARDPYTAGHSTRVSAHAEEIATVMGLPERQVENIRIGAQLHDIGKIGIPDAVLLKAGPLSAEEYGLIKLHPQIGRRILERVERFADYLASVEMHHENHDGSGYPYGLAGHAIPIDARIVHVADAFDAMTTSRSYRQGLSFEEGCAELRAHAGRQFDPEVVAAFLGILEDPENPAGIVATGCSPWSMMHSMHREANSTLPQRACVDDASRPRRAGEFHHFGVGLRGIRERHLASAETREPALQVRARRCDRGK